MLLFAGDAGKSSWTIQRNDRTFGTMKGDVYELSCVRRGNGRRRPCVSGTASFCIGSYFKALYASSVTASIHSLDVPSPGSSTAFLWPLCSVSISRQLDEFLHGRIGRLIPFPDQHGSIAHLRGKGPEGKAGAGFSAPSITKAYPRRCSTRVAALSIRS